MTLRAYAERISVNEDTATKWKHTAEVAVSSGGDFDKLSGYMRHLAVIHAAPQETWKTWVARTLDNQWTGCAIISKWFKMAAHGCSSTPSIAV